MAFCTTCGEPMPDAVRFCPACGAAIGASDTERTVAARAPDAAYDRLFEQPTVARTYGPPPPAEKAEQRGYALWVAAGVSVVVAALAIGAVVLHNRNGQRQAGPPANVSSISSVVTSSAVSSAPSAPPSTTATSAPQVTQVAPPPVTRTTTVTVAPQVTSSSTEPDPAADPNATASADMAAIRSSDLSSTSLDGTWSAQVASQYVGVTDPSIQSGPLSMVDIERVYQQNVSRFTGYQVALLKQNDFGKISSSPQQIWITLVVLSAPDRASVESWCASTYGLSVDAAKQVCVARQMVPPHN